MTKLTFNGARFCNYARWDLTVNSGFYRKMALLIFGSMMTIILFTYLVVPTFKGFHFDPSEKDPVSGVVVAMWVFVAFYSWVAIAHTFHCMLNRQGRILELTIPASTIERFVWHVLVVTVGTQLVLCVSFALADLAHLLLASVYGLQNVHSLWVEAYSMLVVSLGELEIFDGDGAIHMNALVMWGILGEASFLLLINAWKYRYTVMSAIVVKTVIGLVESLLLGFVFRFGGLDPINFFPYNMVYIRDSLILWQVIVMAVEIVWAYRLFSRAQVTSRSNP